jgi:hypothetical protein
MSFRRPLMGLSLVVIAVVTVIVLQQIGPRARAEGASGSPAASAALPSASAPPEAVQGLDADVSPTYAGPSYDPKTTRSPTRHKPQSKLWYHDGLWWGVLVDEASGEFRIWWLNVGTHRWVDTGTLVDERSFARQDVYSDGDDLFVASGGANEDSARHAVEISRYRYDASRRIYTPVPDYPIRITPGGVDAVTITRDSTGAIWAAFVSLGHVRVVRSDPSGLQWSDPFILPGRHASVAADQATIVSLDNRVGVLWSNQEEQGLFFATHRDGDPLETWASTEEVLAGTQIADDHLSIRRLERADGVWIYAVAKTSLDQSLGRNQQLPQIVFLARSPAGTWSSYMVGRVADHHTRPILVLDAEHDQALVFLTSPFDGGEIYMKSSSLDRISFPLGVGTPVITYGAVPKVNNATSTRDPVTSQTGLVVLAADDTAGKYLHVELGMSGQRTPAQLPLPPQASLLLQATWEGLPDGEAMRKQGWDITPPAADAVVAEEGGRKGVRLAAPTAVASRLCHAIPSFQSGHATVTVRLYIEKAALGDTHIVSVRGRGSELTGARFLGNGGIAYRVGQVRDQGAAAWAPGTWYELQLNVDLDRHTYDWRVTGAGERQLLSVSNLPLVVTGAPADEVCVESPPEAGGGGMLVDQFVVTWEAH